MQLLSSKGIYDSDELMTLNEMLEKAISNHNKEKAIGSNIHITDALNWRNQGIAIRGNTTQKQGTGKQLFDKDNANVYIGGYLNGSSMNIKSGTGGQILYIPCEENTTYTISKIIDGVFRVGSTADVPALNVSLIAYDNDAEANSITINTGEGANYLCVYFYSPSLSTLDPTTILNSIMIELGDTAHEREDYTGGQAGPTPTNPQNIVGVTGTQKILVSNKNIFDMALISQQEGYNTYNSSTGLWTTNSSQYTYRSIFYGAVGSGNNRDVTKIPKLLIPGTYTVKFFDYSNSSSGSISFTVFNEDGTKKYDVASLETSDTTGVVTFPIGEPCYLDIRRNAGSGSISFSKIQIELNSTATPYTEHKGLSKTLHLGDIWLGTSGNYKCYIVKENVKWYLKENLRRVVFDGSENWSYRITDNNVHQFYRATGTTNTVHNNNQKSNYGKYKNNSSVVGTVGDFEILANNNIMVVVDANETAESWATKLGTTNLVALIPTSTTKTTEITDTTLLEDLEELLEELQTYKNETIIAVTPASGNSAQLEVTYLKDDRAEMQQDIADIKSALLSLGANV